MPSEACLYLNNRHQISLEKPNERRRETERLSTDISKPPPRPRVNRSVFLAGLRGDGRQEKQCVLELCTVCRKLVMRGDPQMRQGLPSLFRWIVCRIDPVFRRRILNWSGRTGNNQISSNSPDPFYYPRSQISHSVYFIHPCQTMWMSRNRILKSKPSVKTPIYTSAFSKEILTLVMRPRHSLGSSLRCRGVDCSDSSTIV